MLLIAALLTTGCSGFDILNSIVPQNNYRKTSDIAYGPDPRQKLDVYQPKGAKPIAGIVVFFYGGYWRYGEKSEYQFVGQALTAKGYIAVLPNYRLYPQVRFPAFVEDGALAVRWVHDNARRLGGDPQHIYLMGHSAGAHIAALLTLDGHYLKNVGLDRSDIRATAGLAGPYDFVVGVPERPTFNLSATKPSDPDMEPIHFVDGREPPMILLQGGKDTVVLPGNAMRLADRIHQMEGSAQVLIYPDRDHSTVVLALATWFHWLAPVLEDADHYFQQHR